MANLLLAQAQPLNHLRIFPVKSTAYNTSPRCFTMHSDLVEAAELVALQDASHLTELLFSPKIGPNTF